MSISKCTNCGSSRQYKNKKELGGSAGAPVYLAGLASMWSAPKYDVVICSDCGHLRLFVRPPALEKLRTSDKWEPI